MVLTMPVRGVSLRLGLGVAAGVGGVVVAVAVVSRWRPAWTSFCFNLHERGSGRAAQQPGRRPA